MDYCAFDSRGDYGEGGLLKLNFTVWVVLGQGKFDSACADTESKFGFNIYDFDLSNVASIYFTFFATQKQKRKKKMKHVTPRKKQTQKHNKQQTKKKKKQGKGGQIRAKVNPADAAHRWIAG